MDVLLTIDVEDFINLRSTLSLSRILYLLDRFNLKAIFFFTGQMAEKIAEYPRIIKRLEKHTIGYHSSAHSVRPGILEFCDVEKYEQAVEISLRRETSHINPLTGIEEGNGGIKTLTEVFRRRINSFRAPSCAWAPPHLEALKKLGIDFDFSTDISRTPFLHKGMVFYPSPLWVGYQIRSFRSILHYAMGVYLNALRRFRDKVLVLGLHPCQFVNSEWWDSIYRSKKLEGLQGVQGLSIDVAERSYLAFEVLLRHLKNLEHLGLVRITSSLQKTDHKQPLKSEDIQRIYDQNLRKYVNVYGSIWKPKYLFSHFSQFFGGQDKSYE